MNKKEKAAFVRNITRSIAAEIIRKIQDGRIPAEWDGHELREILADKFQRERTPAMQNGRSRRARDYRNAVSVNCL